MQQQQKQKMGPTKMCGPTMNLPDSASKGKIGKADANGTTKINIGTTAAGGNADHSPCSAAATTLFLRQGKNENGTIDAENIIAARRRSSLAAITRKKADSSKKIIGEGGEENGEEETAELRKDLLKLIIGDEHLLKIKAQFMEERCALNLQRPVSFRELEHYFQNKYGRLLNFYYTTLTRELMVQIRNQEELDQVVQLHERTNGTGRHRMRLILSQKRDQQFEQQTTAPCAPMGLFSGFASGGGIIESAMSDTSSLWSLISSSSQKRTPGGSGTAKMSCWAEEEGQQLPETPRAPASWREGRCLGRGAFGHVFVCLADTGEQLAVKKIFLHGNSRQRSRVLATLENELNLLGSLRHPNIVQYLGVAERQDCVNIFMELMSGGSLKDQISEYGPLSEQLSVNFGGQILRGLAYLHSRDIVHRDIKPANILRYTRAQVKIADFGSAKFLQAVCSEQGVDIQGTPHYTAPEIVRDNRRFEARSDVWSVGITLHEMLSTLTPWAGTEPAAVHIRIAFECPRLTLPDGLSKSFRSVIGLMLSREPEERPTAAELLQMRPFCSNNGEEAVAGAVNNANVNVNVSGPPSANGNGLPQ